MKNDSFKKLFLIQIICIELYGFKYSYLTWILFKQIYLMLKWYLNRYYHSDQQKNGNEEVNFRIGTSKLLSVIPRRYFLVVWVVSYPSTRYIIYILLVLLTEWSIMFVSISFKFLFIVLIILRETWFGYQIIAFNIFLAGLLAWFHVNSVSGFLALI